MKDKNETTNATAVHLPAFSSSQPLTWFRRAERHFHLKKITNSTTKADHTIEMLPESVFQHISPWLDTQLAEIKYEDLKATLLRTFCPTPAVRARRILDLPHQLSADRTPTQVWHEISTLRQLPDMDAETGLPKQLDLAKEIWLMCLAPQVRSAMFNTDSRDTDELIKEAEQRHNAHHAASQLRPSTTMTTDITAVRRRPLTTDRQPAAASTATVSEPFICWYHRNHGDKAQKCSEGCQYSSKSKNFTGSRA